MNNWQQTAHLLQRSNVRKLIFAYLITYLGTAMAPIAMAFGVLEISKSTKSMSLVMASMTVATIVVLLISGVIADRCSRKKVIIFAESSAMLIQALIAVLFISGHAQIWSLALLMFLNGIALGFNAPATMGLIPQLVEKKELQALNSVLGIARNTAMIAGAALGGLLVALIGAGWTIAIDAASFGVSALLFFSLKPKATTKADKNESLTSQLKAGWKMFSSYTWLWAIVVQFAFVLAAYQSALTVLGPAISKRFFEGAASWGWIMAAMSAGLFLGGIIGIRARPKYPMRFASFCVFSAALIPLSLALPAPVWLIALAAFVNGICWELFGIIWVSTLQKKIAPEMLSRVSAYDHIGSIAMVPLGIVVVGYFYEWFGYRQVSLGAAALIIAATIAVLLVKDVWRMKSME